MMVYRNGTGGDQRTDGCYFNRAGIAELVKRHGRLRQGNSGNWTDQGR